MLIKNIYFFYLVVDFQAYIYHFIYFFTNIKCCFLYADQFSFKFFLENVSTYKMNKKNLQIQIDNVTCNKNTEL